MGPAEPPDVGIVIPTSPHIIDVPSEDEGAEEEAEDDNDDGGNNDDDEDEDDTEEVEVEQEEEDAESEEEEGPSVAKYCPKRGTKAEEGDRFCRNCGKSLEKGDTASITETEDEGPPFVPVDTEPIEVTEHEVIVPEIPEITSEVTEPKIFEPEEKSPPTEEVRERQQAEEIVEKWLGKKHASKLKYTTVLTNSADGQGFRIVGVQIILSRGSSSIQSHYLTLTADPKKAKVLATKMKGNERRRARLVTG